MFDFALPLIPLPDLLPEDGEKFAVLDAGTVVAT